MRQEQGRRFEPHVFKEVGLQSHSSRKLADEVPLALARCWEGLESPITGQSDKISQLTSPGFFTRSFAVAQCPCGHSRHIVAVSISSIVVLT
jgi:hypothetical protein